MLLVAVWTPLGHIKPSNRNQNFNRYNIDCNVHLSDAKKESSGMGACVAFYKQNNL
jgi:hypothetical protein